MKLLPLLLLFSAVARAQLITEILADPSPSHGLPGFEFIEIYHPGPGPLQLKGYALHYGQSTAVFPEHQMQPDSYAVVCRFNRAKDFSGYGTVIPLTNFSLPNEGASLLLKNPKGLTVDEVQYSATWLKGKEGFSLERINLTWPCLQGTNWAPSTHPTGGTPGRKNEQSPPPVYPPTVLQQHQWTDSTLTLVFSQPLLFPTLLQNALLEGGEIRTLLRINPETYVLQYTREKPAVQLHLSNLQDCMGRPLAPQSLPFEVFPPPALGEIFISEISFDALHPDYVEISCSVPVLLQGWSLARLKSSGEERIILTGSRLSPYTVFTADSSGLRAAFPRAENLAQTLPFLSLPQDSATLVLRSPEGVIYDRIHYATRLHAPLLAETRGVALERTQYAPPLWQSSPSDQGHGTPGKKNAVPLPGKIGFWTEPDLFNPLVEQSTLKYSFPFSGLQAQILVLDRQGRKVKSYPQTFTLGASGEIPWDGTGEGGKPLPNGLYVFAVQVYGKELRQVFYAKIALISP